jgi:hypothetical protein
LGSRSPARDLCHKGRASICFERVVRVITVSSIPGLAAPPDSLRIRSFVVGHFGRARAHILGSESAPSLTKPLLLLEHQSPPGPTILILCLCIFNDLAFKATNLSLRFVNMCLCSVRQELILGLAVVDPLVREN